MELFKLDAVPLAILFLVPGFIVVKVFDLLVPTERRDWSKHVLEAFAYGTLNLALWSWAIDWLISMADKRPWITRSGMFTVLFVSPLLMGIGLNALLRWPWVRQWVRHPTPTAWDHFFGSGQPCWMLFRMKSGSLLGGLYGKGSFASSYPHARDVYVGQVWRVDEAGRFHEPIAQTAGMLVSMDDCESIECFEIGGADGNKGA